MPEVADDPTSATLTAWLIGESGDFVSAQSIATVETDTSLLSIEVSEPGFLIKPLVRPGGRVEPGSPLAVLGAPGEVIDDVEQLMVSLGLAVAPETGARMRAVEPGDPLSATTWPPHAHPPVGPDAPDFVMGDGVALARAGVVDGMAGAGVEAPGEAPAWVGAEAGAAAGPDVETEVDTDVATEVETEVATVEELVEAASAEPLAERAVARRVVGWADTLAEAVVDAVLVSEPRAVERPAAVRQVQLREVVRADELLTVVSKLDTVSLLALVVKAVAVTTRQVPLRPGPTAIADIAIQRSTSAGVIAPVVHVANLMTVSSLTATLTDLDARARQGRLASGEVKPASVTILDLGTEGVAEGQVDATATCPAMLTLGSVVVRPVVEGGRLVPGRVMTLSLSCDAGRIDTATAARWLAHLAALLEQPLHFLT